MSQQTTIVDPRYGTLLLVRPALVPLVLVCEKAFFFQYLINTLAVKAADDDTVNISHRNLSLIHI